MDVIAGKPVLETEVKQHSARFKLDYSQVECLFSFKFPFLALSGTLLMYGL